MVDSLTVSEPVCNQVVYDPVDRSDPREVRACKHLLEDCDRPLPLLGAILLLQRPGVVAHSFVPRVRSMHAVVLITFSAACASDRVEGERMQVPELAISRSSDRWSLVRLLANQLSEGDLRQIARADYGQDEQEHFAQLQIIAKQGVVSTPLNWHPGEVLSLSCWSEADQVMTAEQTLAVYRRRAFCCGILLAASCDEDGPYVDRHTLIQLIESVDALGGCRGEAADLMLSMIHANRDADLRELAFTGFALLRFALVLPKWKDADLMILLTWIMQVEDSDARERRAEGIYRPDQWLKPKDKHDRKWRQLGVDLVGRVENRHDADVREIVGVLVTTLLA